MFATCSLANSAGRARANDMKKTTNEFLNKWPHFTMCLFKLENCWYSYGGWLFFNIFRSILLKLMFCIYSHLKKKGTMNRQRADESLIDKKQFIFFLCSFHFSFKYFEQFFFFFLQNVSFFYALSQFDHQIQRCRPIAFWKHSFKSHIMYMLQCLDCVTECIRKYSEAIQRRGIISVLMFVINEI